MRFRLVHKLASYLLAAAAVVTLAATGTVPPLTLALLAGAGILSWFIEPERRLGVLVERLALVFNLITVALFALAVLQVAHGFPEIDLTPFLNFVLFLLGYKLCQRRSNRDYLQIYVLSFLVMLAAAWQAIGATFMAGFAVYVLLAPWTLILFHLRREIEENYLLRHAGDAKVERVTVARVLNSRRVVGGQFFLATGVVGVLVLGGAGLVFATIPRVGIGFILGGVRRQTAVAGFSDQVKLGMHGVLSLDNQTVVLRARVPRLAALAEAQRAEQIAGLYWRGTVYDTYDSGQWIRSRDERTRTLFSSSYDFDTARTYLLVSPQAARRPASRKEALADATEQHIEVVALSHPVAFALDQPVGFAMPPPPAGSFTAAELEPRWSGELGLRLYRINPANPASRQSVLPEFPGARYRAYSRDLHGLSRPGAGLPASRLAPAGLAPYLAPPRGQVSPRVRELALTITRGKTTPAAKAEAVVRWLQSTHKYTTKLERDESIPDPLEDFLFHQTAGHCEYFASAAAVLLRLAGVPTRYVNGFLGGEWNELRQAVTIRENRAHSWVEAYMGTQGWVRVEATPAAARSTHMSQVRALIDTIELFWSNWVVEYSASQQLLLAKRLGRQLGWSGPGFRPRYGHKRLSRNQVLGVTAAAVLLVGLYSLRRLPRWRAAAGRSVLRRRGEPPIFQLYRKTVDRLAAQGLPRRPDETPHEYAARVAREGGAGTAELGSLTEHYAASRYGETPVPPDLLRQLRQAAEAVGRR